jgi:hypothetical protein
VAIHILQVRRRGVVPPLAPRGAGASVTGSGPEVQA